MLTLHILFAWQGREWSSFHTLADPITTTALPNHNYYHLPFYRLKKQTQFGKGDSMFPRHTPMLDLNTAGPSRVCPLSHAGTILAAVETYSEAFMPFCWVNGPQLSVGHRVQEGECLFQTLPKANDFTVPSVLIIWCHQHCHLAYKTDTKT